MLKSLFSIKNEHQITSAFDIFLLQNTVGTENVTLSRIALRYYRDSVTVILTARSLQTYVMTGAVTEEIATRNRRLGEFSVSKWLKLTQFHLFTPLFD